VLRDRINPQVECGFEFHGDALLPALGGLEPKFNSLPAGGVLYVVHHTKRNGTSMRRSIMLTRILQLSARIRFNWIMQLKNAMIDGFSGDCRNLQ
jgi:hypothetical protein